MNIPKLAIFNFEPGTDTAITSGVSMQINQGFDETPNNESAILTTYRGGEADEDTLTIERTSEDDFIQELRTSLNAREDNDLGQATFVYNNRTLYFDPTGDWDEKEDGTDTIRKLTLLDVLNSTTTDDAWNKIDSLEDEKKNEARTKIKNDVQINQYALGTLFDNDTDPEKENDVLFDKFRELTPEEIEKLSKYSSAIEDATQIGFVYENSEEDDVSGRRVQFKDENENVVYTTGSTFVMGENTGYENKIRDGLKTYFFDYGVDEKDSFNVEFDQDGNPDTIADGEYKGGFVFGPAEKLNSLFDMDDQVEWVYDSTTNSFAYHKKTE